MKHNKPFENITIVTRKLSELTDADYNPRQLSKNQYVEIKKSLTKFGFVDPMIINIHPDRKNIIIGGHQRKNVWLDMGNKEAPCVELSLSIEDEQELNIRLNKNTGSFDFDILANHFEVPDLLDFGFEPFELGISSTDETIAMINSEDEEWVDMPEFDAKDIPYKMIIAFETEEARDEFDALHNIEFTRKQSRAWSTWYPFKDRQDTKSLKYEE